VLRDPITEYTVYFIYIKLVLRRFRVSLQLAGLTHLLDAIEAYKITGFLQPPDGPQPVAGAIPMEFGDVERGYQYMPAPPGGGAPNDEVPYGLYDSGPPNLALDRLRELRLRHQQERVQNQAPQQRPVRLPRGQPVPSQAGIALRLPRGNAF
jgi:hypothetical protein